MEIKKFAAIDIGSNSVRLLISNVLLNGEGPFFKKSSLIRVPVRLGNTAFTNHQIPEVSVQHLEETMLAFKHLMKEEWKARPSFYTRMLQKMKLQNLPKLNSL